MQEAHTIANSDLDGAKPPIRVGPPTKLSIRNPEADARNAGADFNSASSDFKALGAFFCNFQLCHCCCSSAGVAHGQPRAPVPYLVGSRLPSPYHFPARIQSFQAVAAPFPGDSVVSSGAAIPATETSRFKKIEDRLGGLRRD